MIKLETQVRVRYAETDQMGYAYYGHYASYYEIARVEAFRLLGYSYRKLEEDDRIMMPVLEMKTRYHHPAKYDDLIRIELEVPTMPTVRILFKYKLYNQDDILLNTGETMLVFVDAETKKPKRLPEKVLKMFRAFYTEENS